MVEMLNKLWKIGLVQISDEATLLKFVTDALDNNPQSIEDYKMVKVKLWDS